MKGTVPDIWRYINAFIIIIIIMYKETAELLGRETFCFKIFQFYCSQPLPRICSSISFFRGIAHNKWQ
jgi:hypothetical protein